MREIIILFEVIPSCSNPHISTNLTTLGRGNVLVAYNHLKSSYLKNTTITSADFHSSKGPTPGVYKQGNCWQAWGYTEI